MSNVENMLSGCGSVLEVSLYMLEVSIRYVFMYLFRFVNSFYSGFIHIYVKYLSHRHIDGYEIISFLDFISKRQ